MPEFQTTVQRQEHRLGTIAGALLVIFFEQPSPYCASEICRVLNLARGQKYVHDLDVGRALKMLEDRELLVATEERHPSNGRHIRRYRPTFDGALMHSLAKNAYLADSANKKNEDELLADAIFDFAIGREDAPGDWWPKTVTSLINILRRAGIVTVKDLVAQKESRVYNLKYVGCIRMELLDAFMSYHGLKFAE